jgi:hypothetical protein
MGYLGIPLQSSHSMLTILRATDTTHTLEPLLIKANPGDTGKVVILLTLIVRPTDNRV